MDQLGNVERFQIVHRIHVGVVHPDAEMQVRRVHVGVAVPGRREELSTRQDGSFLDVDPRQP
jgi:hypothetical protein